MWIIYESCNLEEMVGKISGKKYTAYALRGMKKGFGDAPDTPYLKPVFENQACSVKEQGVWRDGISIVQYLNKACKPGELLELRFDRSGPPPFDILSIEKKVLGQTNPEDLPTYEPLTPEQAAAMRTQQQQTEATQPVQAPAPAPTQHAPLPWD